MILLALCAALLPAMALAESIDGEGPLYLENEWSFVDTSMDVSGGIPEDAEGVLAAIREAGVLRVATEPYYPPQEFIDPDLSGQDSYVGPDMELARLIAKRMGVELEIVPMDFSVVLDAVAEGNCDLAVSALSYTPGRASTMTLSKGYYYAGESAGSGLMIRAEDLESITDLDSLKGLNLAAQMGSLQEALLAENVFRYHEFRRLSSVSDVYRALEDGSVDAAAVDMTTGMAYVANNPECGLAMAPGFRFKLEEQYEGDRVAAKKGETQLIAFVNGVIDEVLPSGQYQAWFDEYAARAEALGM